jgi:2-polyprenyl-3-methyl-5-hydroxy-6-metoxy-1,4-benzoquinol methylase
MLGFGEPILPRYCDNRDAHRDQTRVATNHRRLRVTKLDAGSRDRLRAMDVVRLARTIYADAHGGIKYKQMLRPWICPFHILIDLIPSEANILDVGCGAGLFISALARLGRIRSAVGFDADEVAIQVAQGVAAKLAKSERIRFEHRNAGESWPAGRFDVVCLIDVMHHVRPEQQVELLKTAADHVAEKGILIYKDMARRPHWRAWANRLHDLVSVGEWIHYAKLDDVISWGRMKGLHLDGIGAINMLWYGHEWCVLRRPDEKT